MPCIYFIYFCPERYVNYVFLLFCGCCFEALVSLHLAACWAAVFYLIVVNRWSTLEVNIQTVELVQMFFMVYFFVSLCFSSTVFIFNVLFLLLFIQDISPMHCYNILQNVFWVTIYIEFEFFFVCVSLMHYYRCY